MIVVGDQSCWRGNEYICLLARQAVRISTRGLQWNSNTIKGEI